MYRRGLSSVRAVVLISLRVVTGRSEKIFIDLSIDAQWDIGRLVGGSKKSDKILADHKDARVFLVFGRIEKDMSAENVLDLPDNVLAFSKSFLK